LFGTAVTPQGAQRLADALTGAVVDHRLGGFLGVGCRQHLLGCEVAEVREGSAAAAAGVALHDVIVKYDGDRTPDFQTLTKLISAHPAGKTVTMEILRGGETLSKQITLGEWD
jgi:S1-C subfamily serine protease